MFTRYRLRLALLPLCLAALVAAAALTTFRISQRLGIADLQTTGAHRLDLYAASLEREIGKYAYFPATLGLERDVLDFLKPPADKRKIGADRINSYLEKLNERAGTLAIYVLRPRHSRRRPGVEQLATRRQLRRREPRLPAVFHGRDEKRQRPLFRHRHNAQRSRLLPVVGTLRRRPNRRRRHRQGRIGPTGKIVVDRGSAGAGRRRKRRDHSELGRRLEVHHPAPARPKHAQRFRPDPAIQPPRLAAARLEKHRHPRAERQPSHAPSQPSGCGRPLPCRRAIPRSLATDAEHAVDADRFHASGSGR